MLNETQRRTLLRIARESIAAALARQPLYHQSEEFDAALLRPAGAFVTLKTAEGELRGCIGSIQAVQPMFQAVSASAVSAATRDPRFPPVTLRELPSLALEVSVMGPLEIVADPQEIEVGRDGLIITSARGAGLLLPQVATEYGWDRETFLCHTCLKAGLPADSWRRAGLRIERFSAEVFAETHSL